MQFDFEEMERSQIAPITMEPGAVSNKNLGAWSAKPFSYYHFYCAGSHVLGVYVEWRIPKYISTKLFWCQSRNVMELRPFLL